MAAPEALSTTQVKPTSLANPVPGQDEQDELAGFFEDEVPAAGVQVAAAGAGQEAGADEVPADFFADEETESIPIGGEFTETPGPEPSLTGNEQIDTLLSGVRESFQESAARFKSSFGVTPKEKLQGAQQVLGEDNVRLNEKGELERFSRSKGEFVPLDEEGFLDLFDDTLDFSRDILEGSIETAIKGAGLISAPGTLGTSLPASGAAGAALAKSIGDFVQEKVIGIPIDPERNLVLENAVAVGIGATFVAVGSSLSRRAAAKRAAKVSQVGSKESKIAALDEIDQEIKDVVEPIKRLKDEGIIEGEFARVLPGQVGTERVPEFQDVVEKFKNEPEVQGFLIKQKKVAEAAFDKVVGKLKSIVGEPDKGISETFRAKLLDGDGVQGALIGRFRKEAGARLKGTKVPLQNVGSKLNELLEGIGQLDPSGKLRLDQEAIQNTFSVDPNEAKLIGNSLSEMFSLQQGGANFAQIQGALGGMKRKLRNASKKNTAPFRVNTQLRRALADDEVEAIGSGLADSTQAQAFQTAKDSLFKLKNVEDNLKTLLRAPVNARTFTRSLFESGKNISRIKDVKTVADLVEPGLWDEVVFNWLDSVKLSATKFDGITPGPVNWNKVADTVGKLDSQAKKAIFNEDTLSLQLVNDVISFNQTIQNSENLFTSKKFQGELAGIASAAAKAGVTRIGQANLIERLVKSVKDRGGLTIKQFLSEGGIEQIMNTKRIKLIGPGRAKKVFSFLSQLSRPTAEAATRGQAIEQLPQAQQLLQGTGLEEQGQ